MLVLYGALLCAIMISVAGYHYCRALKTSQWLRSKIKSFPRLVVRHGRELLGTRPVARQPRPVEQPMSWREWMPR